MLNTVFTQIYDILPFKIRKIPILNMFTFTCDYNITAQFYMTNLENNLDLYSYKYIITWIR
jgi:hypothetical protein